MLDGQNRVIALTSLAALISPDVCHIARPSASIFSPTLTSFSRLNQALPSCQLSLHHCLMWEKRSLHLLNRLLRLFR
jgi:hypothetical protein